MAAKVYVGNLSWNTSDDGLAQAFSQYGQLTDYVSHPKCKAFRTLMYADIICVLFTDCHEGP